MTYNKISDILRIRRMKILGRILEKLQYNSMLDIGCRDTVVRRMIGLEKIYLGFDTNPDQEAPFIRKEDFMKFETKNKYDVILALQVLEHLSDPVAAINKIKKLAGKYIIISIPYEPLYSMFRLPVPNKEHKFVIFPWALKDMLGQPEYERMMVFGRQYLGVWKVE